MLYYSNTKAAYSGHAVHFEIRAAAREACAVNDAEAEVLLAKCDANARQRFIASSLHALPDSTLVTHFGLADAFATVASAQQRVTSRVNKFVDVQAQLLELQASYRRNSA